MRFHRRLRFLLTGLLFALPAIASGADSPGIELHIAITGNDTNAGTAEHPFATLERARDEIRAIRKAKDLPAGGVAVTLHAGVYTLGKPFVLTAEDSGSASAPITYRNGKGEVVRISGGKTVTDWLRVTDAATLQQLDPIARGKVVSADLHTLGLRDFGEIGGGFGLRGGPGMELFYNDKPMTLSRFPNDGFIKITEAEGPTEKLVGSRKSHVEAIFTYDSDRPNRWKNEKEAWVHGYWFHDWADQRQRIESIDPAAKRMTLAKPYHHYGYRKGQWFYGFNLLCEIDQPGEWYLDRTAGRIYFWPPTDPKTGQATVSVLDTLISVKNTKEVTIQGLTLEAARGIAVTLEGVENTKLLGCTLRNIGSWAIKLSGTRSGVVGCDITATGDGGISLSGGDRRTLTPAGLYAENNHIHDWSRWNRMNRHGIALNGVGNRAVHNALHHSPHSALFFSGNDHLIEFNEIYEVCLESNDAGAVYAGRNWTMRGTMIRHNYLHHIHGFRNRGCVGIYLDDMYSGTTIYGNLFHDVTQATFIGGGHDNTIENNIFVDCKPAVHVDSRGLGWAYKWPQGWIEEIKTKGTLSGVRYNQPPYSERYPRLAKILEQEPAAPNGSLIVRNVFWGGRWDNVDRKAAPFVKFQDNLLNADPLFVNPAKHDFRLQKSSPAFKLGFQPIPIEKIGLMNDGTRASWPVVVQPGHAAPRQAQEPKRK